MTVGLNSEQIKEFNKKVLPYKGADFWLGHALGFENHDKVITEGNHEEAIEIDMTGEDASFYQSVLLADDTADDYEIHLKLPKRGSFLCLEVDTFTNTIADFIMTLTAEDFNGNAIIPKADNKQLHSSNNSLDRYYFHWDGAVLLCTKQALDIGPDAYPTLVSAVVLDDTLTLTYSESLDETSVPAAEDFALAGTSAAVDSVDVDGATVVITLDNPVVSGETITIDYTPGTNKIQDLTPRHALALDGQAVTNNTAPLIVSAEIDGDTVVLTYDSDLDETSTPAGTDFSLGGITEGTIDPVVVDGATVTLTLENAATSMDTVTLNYVPGTNKIKNLAGKLAVALTNYSVTNNTAP